MSRPNLLFLMTDQQRWDALGCVGGWVRTPNLDRLVAGGTCFDQAITTSPVCVPARLSLATGLYPHSTGVWNNCQHTMHPAAATWMRAVRDAGYRTSLFGKTHLHPHGHNDLREEEPLMRAYGLDDIDEIGGPRASCRSLSHMTARWEELGLWQPYRDDYAERFSHEPQPVRPSPLPLEEYADVYVGRRARDYLQGYDREQPWCCWVSFGGPHEPWDAPELFHSRYDTAAMPPAAPQAPWISESGEHNLQRRCAKRLDWPPGRKAEMRANYAANVELIDEQIGELLAVIEARGELEHTVIVFTSDHGEHNGDHDLWAKSTFLDGALRVPLIVSTPQQRAAGTAVRRDAPVPLIDVGATLVDYAGATWDAPHASDSLRPQVEGAAGADRSLAVSELAGERCAFTRDWKAMFAADGRCYALIDRGADPDEQRNHVAERPEMVAELRDALWQHDCRSQPGAPVPIGWYQE